jgi:hypothetical protein
MAQGVQEGAEADKGGGVRQATNQTPSFRSQESTGNVSLVPPRCKSFRYFKPTAVISRTMITAHAGTLAHMTFRIKAFWRTFFLLAIRLYYVYFAVFY